MNKSFTLVLVVMLAHVALSQFEYTPLTAASVPTSSNLQSTINAVQTPAVPYFCPAGYFWTSQYCMACASPSNGYCTCSTQGGCSQLYCFSGYYSVDGVNCVPCMNTGCTKCSQQQGALLCYQCQSNYQLVGNTCVPSANCNTFSLTTDICNQCNPGYYFNWQFSTASQSSRRMLESSGLLISPAPLISAQQQPGYIASFTPQCSPCQQFCALCNQGDACIVCSTNYGLDTTTQRCSPCQVGNCASCDGNLQSGCQKCQMGYYLSNSQAATGSTTTSVAGPKVTCTKCDANCDACNGAGQCISCSTGYNLASGKCYQCEQGCSVCDPTSLQCSTCMPATTPNIVAPATTYTQCTACPSGCLSCKYSGLQLVCLTCQDTYFLQVQVCSACSAYPNFIRCRMTTPLTSSGSAANGVPKVEPTQCAQGYYVTLGSDGLNQCVALTQNLACYNATLPAATSSSSASTTYQCITCLPGTIQFNNLCYPAPAFCSRAGDFANGAFPCSICLSGYYLNAGQCVTCSTGITGCALCPNSTSCSTCMQGAYLAEDTKSCPICSTSQCQSCNKNVCSQCIEGYYLNSTGTLSCMQCPANCATCDTEGVSCLSCMAGYLKQGGGCIRAPQDICLSITSSGCQVCAAGYYLKNQFCVRCLNPDAGFVCRENFIPAGVTFSSSSDATTGGQLTNTSASVVNASTTNTSNTPTTSVASPSASSAYLVALSVAIGLLILL